MALPYDAAELEPRWQARWAAARVYEVDVEAASPDGGEDIVFNLVEFPYPSAAGLHIGHAMTYAGADTWGRFQRMQGRTVFQPIGFDSFGINAENYALTVGDHPRRTIERTIRTYRRQLAALGAGWSWDAEVVTSDPAYYRWTQWVFLQLFRAGLAYQAEAPVLWCPRCATVLAREQTEEGRCERCGAEVDERVMRQWFLRITAYADRLLDGLEAVDWPDRAKNRQRAWIGRRGGADRHRIDIESEPIDGGAVTYRLHDWLISRQRYWGPPIPIIHCPACGPVPVPDDQLPVLLPDIDDVRPTGTGRSPLAEVEGWSQVVCPVCGGPAERETDVSDTFFDSAWYFLRYPTAVRRRRAGDGEGEHGGGGVRRGDDPRAWDEDLTRRWLPVSMYAGGPEHVARHHLYARFVTMALHDLGLVPFAEPFPVIRLHGMLTLDGAKMSKSRGNVVNPDELIAVHGADVARLALLFGRPWDADGPFAAGAVAGAERFLSRVWRLASEAIDRADTATSGDAIALAAAERVGSDLGRLRFNTAIAVLMEALNGLRGDPPSTSGARTLVLALAPLAPHVAEELWARLGGPFSVHQQRWPVAPVASVASVASVAPAPSVASVAPLTPRSLSS